MSLGRKSDGGVEAAVPPPAASARPDPLLGALVNERFRVLAPLARGGMSRVYRAEQLPLGRACAVKVLTPKFEGQHDEEFRKRFFLEASTAAKLTHPNTVRIFDYGYSAEHDAFYIAMELVEGRTLHQALREEGAFEELRAAHVAIEIARALREAHAVGVVHRDLKPGNIMLQEHEGERETVKVLDFGLVKDFTGSGEDLTETGMFLGSPKYMAPEQVLGARIGPATDVYALGVLLYEMLTGKVPFDKGVGTLVAQVNDAVPPMREKNPDASPSLEIAEVVRRCLEKAPEKRYRNMGELVLALRAATGGAISMTETQELLPRVALDVAGPERGAPRSDPPARTSSDRPGATSETPSNMPPPSASATLRGAAVSQAPAPATAAIEMPSLAREAARTRRGPLLVVAALLATGLAGAAVLLSEPAAPRADAPTAEPHEPGPHAAARATPVAARPELAVRLLRVESTPSGASVYEGNKQLCTTTPCQVTWRGAEANGAHRLELDRAGYRRALVGVGDG
ncbi:MAG TPA: protein kinase, partial [Minicystis sp.]|nr:protein kinase [Minicystis sp.]